MGLYLEESSMIGNSTAALIDHAPHADVQETIAVGRCQRRSERRSAAKKPVCARPEDAIPAGTCAPCGCVGKHPTPADCIDQLRDAYDSFLQAIDALPQPYLEEVEPGIIVASEVEH